MHIKDKIKTAAECRANYKQKYIHSNILCTLCQLESEDQQHILREYDSDEVAQSDSKYDDIFSDDVHKEK